MSIEARQMFNFIQGSDITGESSYDIWKRLGNEGTEADFLEFIKSGPKGEKGDPATSYFVTASEPVIKKDINNTLLPASITFRGFYRVGTELTRNEYLGRFIIQETTNGTTWENKYASTQDESFVVYTPSSTDVTFIKCTLLSAENNSIELDHQSVAILSEVKPDDIEVLSAILSNDAHVVATDYKGEDGDYSECISSIQVFSGIRDVTGECSYEAITCNGLEGNWDLDNYTYRVNNLTSDAGYVDIIARYNETSITKRFSISKAKRGKSAYEAWLEYEGNEGKTEEEYMSEQQSDWNENDETKLGYIKNRPFYEEKTEEILYTVNNESVTVPESQYIDNQFSIINPLIEGETYTVIFDDQEYSCIARNDGYDDIYIGNQSLTKNDGWEFPEDITSDEPFFFYTFQTDNTLYTSTGDHSLSVYRYRINTTIHKLDEKYLPTIQVDWTQNDESASGYIKNRTHYEEEIDVAILEETNYNFGGYSYQFGKYDCGNYFASNTPLEVGKQYKVIFNGVEYKGTATIDSEYDNIYFGNGAYLNNTDEDNGMPFAIYYESDTTWLHVLAMRNWDGEHTFSIYAIESATHQLDEKFIPDTIARTKDINQTGADWKQTDETAPDYIKNKPTEEDALALAMELGLIDPVTAEDGSIYTDENGLIYTL